MVASSALTLRVRSVLYLRAIQKCTSISRFQVPGILAGTVYTSVLTDMGCNDSYCWHRVGLCFEHVTLQWVSGFVSVRKLCAQAAVRDRRPSCAPIYAWSCCPRVIKHMYYIHRPLRAHYSGRFSPYIKKKT